MIKNFDIKKKIIIVVIIVTLFIAFFIYRNVNQTSSEIDFNMLLDESSEIDIEKANESEKGEKKTSENIVNNEEKKATETIVIHITGEVKKEGVIYLKKGARLVDAIKEAGGETKEADLSQVNLAYELQDGQKIYIPNKNEKIEQYIISTNGETIGNNGIAINNKNINKEGEKVNINTASQNELDSLPGIGPALAQRIIDYRNENGNFNAIEDIQQVKGIGDSKFEEIKDKIVVWTYVWTNKKIDVQDIKKVYFLISLYFWYVEKITNYEL